MTDDLEPVGQANSAPSRVLPAALEPKARAAAERATQYLAGRQSRTGGFCFYRWQGIDEPGVRDTWHAVAALTLLGAEVPRRRDVVAFLRAFQCTGFDDRYHRALALARLGEDVSADVTAHIDRLDAAAALADARMPFDARLQRALRIVTLQRALAIVRNADAVADSILGLRREGGWGDKPNLVDTWIALAVLDTCGQRRFPDGTARFIQDLEVPSFGFTATRDSLSAPLEVLHAGLRACALLELPVRHLADAVACVLACQSGNGGFARTSDALPDIALTHVGLLALAAAGLLPVPASPGWQHDSGG